MVQGPKQLHWLNGFKGGHVYFSLFYGTGATGLKNSVTAPLCEALPGPGFSVAATNYQSDLQPIEQPFLDRNEITGDQR